MYEESAGAEDYVVMATDSWGNVQTFECNSTSEGMCSLPPLMCSQNLTFTLKALDQQCSSAPSNAVTTETGKSKIEWNYKHKLIVTKNSIYHSKVTSCFLVFKLL